jgi:hypothetical protein
MSMKHLRPPHELRCRALSALERIDSEQSAVGELRTCLEEMVDDLYRRFVPRTPPPEDLKARIRILEFRGVVPSPVVTAMQRLRIIGNKGAHPGRKLQSQQVDEAIRLFMQVLDWCRDRVWKSKSGRYPS